MVEGKVVKVRTLVEGGVPVLLASCYLEEWMSRFESKPYPSGLLQPKML
jgi:hypothetical protein